MLRIMMVELKNAEFHQDLRVPICALPLQNLNVILSAFVQSKTYDLLGIKNYYNDDKFTRVQHFALFLMIVALFCPINLSDNFLRPFSTILAGIIITQCSNNEVRQMKNSVFSFWKLHLKGSQVGWEIGDQIWFSTTLKNPLFIPIQRIKPDSKTWNSFFLIENCRVFLSFKVLRI